MLPKDFPIGLNTTALGQFIPELAKAFPNRPVQLALSAQAPKPVIMSCTTAGFNVTLNMFVGVNVVLANGTIVDAFKLRADIVGAGKAWIGGFPVMVFPGTCLQHMSPSHAAAAVAVAANAPVHRAASAGTKSSLVGNLTFLEVPLALESSVIGNITAEVEGLAEIAALLAAVRYAGYHIHPRNACPPPPKFLIVLLS